MSSERSTGPQTRRAFLTTAAGAALVGTAGCTVEYNGPSIGGGGGPALDSELPATGGAGSGFAYEQPAFTGQDATHVARTADDLVTGVEQGSADNPSLVWLPPDAAIDMTGRSTVTVRNSIIAGARHTNHIGPLIYTETYGEGTSQYDGGGIFDMQENSRLTGLRIRGPFSNVHDNPRHPGYLPQPSYDSRSRRYEFYDNHAARGLTVSHGAVQVDNCELFGWSRMAVYVDCPRSYNTDQEQSYPQFNNSSFHNNMMDSSGYGIEVIRGHPTIRRCYLNANRHSIAGFGLPDSGYTISECYQGEIISSFPIDQHYLAENNGSGSSPSDYRYRYRGGGHMRILNSTFACLDTIEDSVVYSGSRQPALALQGLPLEGVEVRGNVFRHPGPESAFSQGHLPGGTETNSFGLARWTVENNEYGWEPNTNQ